VGVRRIGGRLAAAAIVVLLLVWTLGPLYWMLTTSFKTPLEATSLRPTAWPSQVTLQNYLGLVQGPFPFPLFLLNSLVTSAATAVVTLALASLAGYSFARGRYLLKGPLMHSVLATQMLPLAVLLVPLYLLLLRAQLLDTYQGVVLGYCSFALPFGAWMMKGFFEAVPREIEEAARVDGASNLRVLISVVLPTVGPGLLTTAAFVFLDSWNNLLYPLTLVTSIPRQTLPPGLLLSFTGVLKTDWGGMMAASCITTVPLALGFLLLQRSLVRGLTSGAVTGV
jgi:multiple sugar transport system permease protein